MTEQNHLATWCRGVLRLMDSGLPYPQHEAAAYAHAMRETTVWPDEAWVEEANEVAAIAESAARALECFSIAGQHNDLLAALLAVEAWWDGQQALEARLLGNFFAALPAA